jgi:flagellar motor switch protein FliN
MNEILSQEEIDALLRGEIQITQDESVSLTPEEKDALGEIGNISMGTAATTLFTLLNHKVTITTPEVDVTTLSELAMQYPMPFVAVEIQYTEGFQGRNLLIVKEDDVKIITDLMMGGDGTNIGGELTELHLSAIGEVMNQMMGSSSTSLATMFGKNINISPPRVFIINFATENSCDLFESDEKIVRVNFKMEISNILNSYMMQLIPIEFAKNMVENLLKTQGLDGDEEVVQENNPPVQPAQSTLGDIAMPSNESLSGYKQNFSNYTGSPEASWTKPVDVRPVHFQPLEESEMQIERSNIDLILDVPLEVSVELGRTKKTIKEILELGAGSIIELDKMAGEPVDILVNGKMIARGEVVVIDDNFGVRITDIISPVKRLTQLK